MPDKISGTQPDKLVHEFVDHAMAQLGVRPGQYWNLSDLDKKIP